MRQDTRQNDTRPNRFHRYTQNVLRPAQRLQAVLSVAFFIVTLSGVRQSVVLASVVAPCEEIIKPVSAGSFPLADPTSGQPEMTRLGRFAAEK